MEPGLYPEPSNPAYFEFSLMKDRVLGLVDATGDSSGETAGEMDSETGGEVNGGSANPTVGFILVSGWISASMASGGSVPHPGGEVPSDCI